MAFRQDTMMNPSIEGLLDAAGSKFSLVTLSSKRAREINSYFNQLGEGLGAIIPPQVTSVARKPLSIAFEEIGSGKIVPADPEEIAAEEAAKAQAAAEAAAKAEAAAEATDGTDDGDNGSKKRKRNRK